MKTEVALVYSPSFSFEGSQSSSFLFFNSLLFPCRNRYTVRCWLPLRNIRIASFATSACSMSPMMEIVCPNTEITASVSSSMIFRVFPSFPMILPFSRFMSDWDLPTISRKSMTDKAASSSQINLNARSGEKPLPIAMTTSLALKRSIL